MKFRHISYLIVALGVAITVSSCSVPKNVAYFQDTENTQIVELAKASPIRLKPEDRVRIIVKSKDNVINDLFNLNSYSSIPNANDQYFSYRVDESGNIDFPVLGKLKVEGMTSMELAGFVKGELMGRDLVKDPVVTVEFQNMGVNMLGEVNRPGHIGISKDKMSIVEALTNAGDISINGRRDNVKVLREENGKVNIYTLDMTDLSSLTKSPAYWLRQDDVVYVEPTDMRKRQTTVNGNNVYNVSFWISVASLITTAVTTVGVFVVK